MAAKIYSAPKSIKQPIFNYTGKENYNKVFKAYRKDETRYCEKLREMLLARKKGKNVGEIISFPVADGAAEYMIASLRPLELVHLPLGDAWDFQYAHLLTAKEVNKKIEENKAMAEFFNKRNKKQS